ncbi:MAG: hypothetical protein ACRETH_01810 [Steroidobacteraceae bacterium]
MPRSRGVQRAGGTRLIARTLSERRHAVSHMKVAQLLVPGTGHGTLPSRPELVNLAIREFLDA